MFKNCLSIVFVKKAKTTFITQTSSKLNEPQHIVSYALHELTLQLPVQTPNVVLRLVNHMCTLCGTS